MALVWENFFAPPTGDTGLSSGTFADVDEWPFSDADFAYLQNDVTDSFTGIDLSSAPGDKKGFRVWMRCKLNVTTPTVDVSMRLLDGATEIWNGGIVIDDFASDSYSIHVFDIPDSAFSGDPAINDLTVELTTLRSDGNNQRLYISGLRVSKSPFTAAQEASLPSSLGSADFACYRASDLALLGAADAEAVVVWPDASGKGRHLVRYNGTDITFEDDVDDYVAWGGAGARFITHWGSRITGNHLWHINLYPEDTTIDQGIISFASDFFGSVSPPTDPNDKTTIGISDEGSGDKFIIMSGDGTTAAHIYGATTVTFDAWVRVTAWVQDADNEHLWFNDDASPDIDGASGSNNLMTVSLGDRESNDRPFQGRITDFWVVDGAGITEANIDDARDDWVAGLGFESVLVYANGDGTIADVVDEGGATTDLYQSIDDDPDTPNDADWVNNQVAAASAFFDLDDMPAGFGNAESLSIEVRVRGQNWDTGNVSLFARVYQSDETTPLTDEIELTELSADGSFANVGGTFTGLVAGSKSIWDGARVRFRWAVS